MNFQHATEWVKDHESIIKGFISKYRNFSPYEECDFMQEAFEAALIATLRSEKKRIPFESAFWVIFRNQVSVITPHPDGRGSNSVPSHLCTGEVEFECLNPERQERQPDIEALFDSVCHILTAKERQVLSWSLGLGHEGKLSHNEIAKRLGCVESNVRDTLNRAFNRIRAQITNGALIPPSLH